MLKLIQLYDIEPNFCRATTAFWKGANALLRHVSEAPPLVDTLTVRPQVNLPPHMMLPDYHTGPIPWKGLNVIVTGKHQFKGQRANVVDVNITPGETKSGLRISVNAVTSNRRGTSKVTRPTRGCRDSKSW